MALPPIRYTAAQGIQKAFDNFNRPMIPQVSPIPQMPMVLNNQYTQGANLALQRATYERPLNAWEQNWSPNSLPSSQQPQITAPASTITSGATIPQGLNTPQASQALFGSRSPEQQLMDMNGQLQYDLPNDTPLRMVDGSGMTTAGAYNNAQGGGMFDNIMGKVNSVVGSTGENGAQTGLGGWGNALKIGTGLAQTWMGMQQMDMAEQQFDFTKSAFEKNYAMQKEAYDENKAAKKRTMESWNK